MTTTTEICKIISFLHWEDQVLEPSSQIMQNQPGFDSWVKKTPWRREWQPTPVFLPGKFHGQRSLAGYSPWSHKESDMTEHACTEPHSQADPILLTNRNCENLIGIALDLQIAMGSIVIFTILISPIQERGISLHQFVSPLISFNSVLQFSAHRT